MYIQTPQDCSSSCWNPDVTSPAATSPVLAGATNMQCIRVLLSTLNFLSLGLFSCCSSSRTSSCCCVLLAAPHPLCCLHSVPHQLSQASPAPWFLCCSSSSSSSISSCLLLFTVAYTAPVAPLHVVPLLHPLRTLHLSPDSSVVAAWLSAPPG